MSRQYDESGSNDATLPLDANDRKLNSWPLDAIACMIESVQSPRQGCPDLAFQPAKYPFHPWQSRARHPLQLPLSVSPRPSLPITYSAILPCATAVPSCLPLCRKEKHQLDVRRI